MRIKPNKIWAKFGKLTIFKVGCPGLTLVSGTANVIYPPFHASIATGWNRESVFHDTHCLQSGL